MAFASYLPVYSKQSSQQKVWKCEKQVLMVNTTSRNATDLNVERSFGEKLPSESRPCRVINPMKKRIRQHLNPLAARWQGRVEVSDTWYNEIFADANLPLLVDVGCGKGRFAESFAQQHQSQTNVLALEIREPLVNLANERAKAKGLHNLHFLACNANVSLADILKTAPRNVLSLIALQFCDPWFKKKHAKRRMVDAQLVEVIHEALRNSNVNGRVFIQTDVLPLAMQMRGVFDAHRGFLRVPDDGWSDDGWLLNNPLPVKTEREICVERRNEPVYRAMYSLASAGWDSDGVWDDDMLRRFAEPCSLNEPTSYTLEIPKLLTNTK